MYTHIYLSIYQERLAGLVGVKKPTRERAETEEKRNWESSAYEMKMEEMVKRREKSFVSICSSIRESSFSFLYFFFFFKKKSGSLSFASMCCHPGERFFLFGDWIIIWKNQQLHTWFLDMSVGDFWPFGDVIISRAPLIWKKKKKIYKKKFWAFREFQK